MYVKGMLLYRVCVVNTACVKKMLSNATGKQSCKTIVEQSYNKPRQITIWGSPPSMLKSRHKSIISGAYVCGSRAYSVDSWAGWVATSWPVLCCQDLVTHTHSVTELPWWATITLSTIMLRSLITFPLAIYQHKVMAQLENLQPEIKAIAEELKKETAFAVHKFGWTQKYARYMYNRSLKKQVTKLIVRDNCHPFKGTIVMWVQLPMWISLSFALRNLTSMFPYADEIATISYLQLTVGGILWFPNLVEMDHSLILPLALGLTNLLIVEMHALRRTKITRFSTVLTNIMRVLSLLMIPIASQVPSALALYWTTSSLFGLGQNVMLCYPQVRRSLGIPATETESLTPFQDMVLNLRIRMKNRDFR